MTGTVGDPSLGLQAALVTTLKADAGIRAIVGDRVFDRFPARPAYPCVAVGTGDQVVALEEDEALTEGSETFLQIQAFSRDEPQPGMQTVKKLAGLIRVALRHWKPALDDHQVDGTDFEGVTYFRDDGLTSRAVMTFRVRSQAAD